MPSSKSKSSSLSTSAHDVHNGNHYSYLAPTSDHYGHEEFWVCCECHEVFLDEPLTGSWVDASEESMTGGIDELHPAYIAPIHEHHYVKGTSSISESVDGYYSIEAYEDTVQVESYEWIGSSVLFDTYIRYQLDTIPFAQGDYYVSGQICIEFTEPCIVEAIYGLGNSNYFIDTNDVTERYDETLNKYYYSATPKESYEEGDGCFMLIVIDLFDGETELEDDINVLFNFMYDLYENDESGAICSTCLEIKE